MISGVHANSNIKKPDIAGAPRILPAATRVIQEKKPDSSKSAPSEGADTTRSDQRRFDDVLKSQKPGIDEAKASKGDASSSSQVDSVEPDAAQKSTGAAQESTDTGQPATIDATDEAVSHGESPILEGDDAVSELVIRESPERVISPDAPAAINVAHKGQAQPQAAQATLPQVATDRRHALNQQRVSSEARVTEDAARQQVQPEPHSGGEQAPNVRIVGAPPTAAQDAESHATHTQARTTASNGQPQQEVDLPEATPAQTPVAASQRAASTGAEQPLRPIQTEPLPSADAPKAEPLLQLERVTDAPTVGKANTPVHAKQPSATPTTPPPDPAAQIVSRGLSAAVAQRGGSMTMQLIPETLGQVRVQMHLEQGVVSVRIETANAAAQSLLNDNLSMLRTSLESKGLLIERLSVHLSPNALGAGTAPSAGTSSGHEAGHGGPQSQMGGQNHNAAGQGSRGNGGDAEHHGTAGKAGLPAESGLEGESAMAAKFGTKLRLRLHAVA